MPLITPGCGGAYDPLTSTLAGLSPLVLQGMLNQAQLALAQLKTGGKPLTVSYAMADGARSVTYAATDEGKLTTWIIQLQRQLNIPTPGRRPIRPFYR